MSDLGIGREGSQVTSYDEVGNANVPQLHRDGADVFVSWTDSITGQQAAYLRQLDGAGRAVSPRILLQVSTAKVLYARTAMGQREFIGLPIRTRRTRTA